MDKLFWLLPCGTMRQLRLLAFSASVAEASKGLPSSLFPSLEPLEPLAEPSAESYFGLAEAKAATERTDGPLPVERVRDISQEDFDARVRLGRPFIVEDAGRNQDLVGSTCRQFHERFPKAKMRAEYTGGRSEHFVSLGSEAWFQKDRFQSKDRLRQEHLSKDLGVGDLAEMTTAP